MARKLLQCSSEIQKGGSMKKPFFIRFLVGNKTIATIYPTPEYAGRHLVADVERLTLKYGKPVKAELEEACCIGVYREQLN
jgi:hypothetical protein